MTATCQTEENLVLVDVEELRKNETFAHCVNVIKLYKSGRRNPQDQFGSDITNQNVVIDVTQSQFDVVYPEGDSGNNVELRGVKKDELSNCLIDGAANEFKL